MLVYVLDLLWCMTSQHGAIGLQTDCNVLWPHGEAARLPHVYAHKALGYGLPPCKYKNETKELC